MKPTKKQLAQNINKIYGKSFDELLTELLTDEEVFDIREAIKEVTEYFKYNKDKGVYIQ